MIILKRFSAVFALFVLIFSTSCVETVVVGSIAGGVLVTRDKTLNDTRKDIEISTKLAAKFVENGLKNPSSYVDITVNEGRVLLTGTLTDTQKAKLAQELAWKVSGVKEIIDEIQIIDKADFKIKDISEGAADYAITTEVDARLIFERKVPSRNYKITTVSRVVYILGVAADEEEISKTLQVISRTRGVKKVVNHLILEGDRRRNS